MLFFLLLIILNHNYNISSTKIDHLLYKLTKLKHIMSHYDQYNVPKLKELLKERGLKTTGKKADLMDRLQEHDLKLKKESGLILLFCKTMIGSYYDIWTSRSDTIASLKAKIGEQTKIPINKLVLEYESNGTRVRLDDNLMICDYNIYPESTLYIIQRLIG